AALGSSTIAATPPRASRVSRCLRGLGAGSEVVLASWQLRVNHDAPSDRTQRSIGCSGCGCGWREYAQVAMRSSDARHHAPTFSTWRAEQLRNSESRGILRA